MSEQGLVSVIIPTLNSAGEIRRCLDAIKRQSYSHVEVIVVDSGNDDTAEIAASYGCKVIRAIATMTRARNIGAAQSVGDYLVHLDSDIILEDDDTVADCVRKCEGGADAVDMPQRYEGKGYWGKCREKEFELYQSYTPLKLARFVSRIAFEKIGGYDETLVSGEDWDVRLRLERAGLTIDTSGTLVIHGWGPVYPSKMLRKSMRYGKTVRRYLNKYPGEGRTQWGPSRIFYLAVTALGKYPRYAAGIVFLKTLEFTAGFIGMVTASRRAP